MKKVLFFFILVFFACNPLFARQLEPQEHTWDISISEFHTLPHFPPMNQDSTLVCWSFATTSFLESEMMRLGKPPVQLSVMYFVYYRLLEKCHSILSTHSPEHFSSGDLFTGVMDIVSTYGIVPASAYEGKKSSTTCYVHTHLYEQIDSLLTDAIKNNEQDTAKVLTQVENILKRYLGAPPSHFNYEGNIYTPILFRDSVVGLPWNAYVAVTSFGYAPYFQFIELKVPDNWKHSARYFNAPIEFFLGAIREAVANGFTVVIDADITEPSYIETKQWCVVPNATRIDWKQKASERDRMFANGETTDDHLMHIVGYTQKNGNDWYLAKDSWHTAWEGPGKGYMMIHSSYIEYKALAFYTHKNALPSLWEFMENKKY
jgi:bleomycin hydrolase